MSSRHKSEQKFKRLFDRVLDGSCSDDERREFSELLDANSELQEVVLEQLRMQALLHWSLSPTSVPQINASGSCDENSLASPKAEALPSKSLGSPGASRWRRWASATAAVLAASVLIGLYVLAPETKPQARVGSFTSLGEAILGPDSTAVAEEQGVVPGTLVVTSGQLAIEFINGVKMKVNGPALCEIQSDMLVRLVRGQATADVPRWARGFTIATPDIEVVDLGTRFGVAKLEDVKTDVVVFEGEVDLKSLEPAKKQFSRRLTQGEAARIDYLGEIERIFQVHSSAHDSDWSILSRLDQGGVIDRVWDNLDGTKSISYYQVVTGGLEEDSPAYVDHPHEWNALSDSGLPEFLRHADYVRTINDYRYMGKLSLQVQLSRDANLYVFFDNRVAVPEWLSEHFENTGAEIGLDEDAWFGNPRFSVELGPGKSIDNVFTVWRRTCLAGETMVLGSMGVGSEARAMYGIAATPR